MKDITISKMNLDTDLPEIASWDDKYWNDKKYKTIRKFILEGKTYYSIREVINLNYEQGPIGTNEKLDIFSIKNEESKLIGFIITDIFDIETEPNLFIHYIVLHPYEQNKGYGTKALHELITNAKKYLGVDPIEIFAHIEKENIASQEIFKKEGFSLEPRQDCYCQRSNYFKAVKYNLTLEK